MGRHLQRCQVSCCGSCLVCGLLRMIPKPRQRIQRQKLLCLGGSIRSITEVFLCECHDAPKQANSSTHRNREACDFGFDRSLADCDLPRERLGRAGISRKKWMAASRCLPDGSFGALDQLLAMACFGQCVRGTVRSCQSSSVGFFRNAS